MMPIPNAFRPNDVEAGRRSAAESTDGAANRPGGGNRNSPPGGDVRSTPVVQRPLSHGIDAILAGEPTGVGSGRTASRGGELRRRTSPSSFFCFIC